MNTIRLCFTATVALLVVTIGGRVASRRDIVMGKKCCPWNKLYDPEVRFCRPPGTDVDEYQQKLRNRLYRGLLESANVSFKMRYYKSLPYCNTTEVLVDVPAEEVRGLKEAPPSPIELLFDYCFDLTPTDELVARKCRPRDQYCGRGNYTCVNKCCQDGYLHVKHPNKKDKLTCKKSEMPRQFTLSAYETITGGNPVGLSNNTVLPSYSLACKNLYLIDDRFTLTTDGNLHFIDEWILPDKEYCLEYYAEDGLPETTELRVFVCSNVKRPVSFLFWVILPPSVACLVLTLIVYATLPYLRNTHGYYVMFYMACQLISFVTAMIDGLVVNDNTHSPFCIIFGYFKLFIVLTKCCWLNVICFDIYWNLRYNNSTNRNTSTSVRTIMYHIYCWGFSSICVSTGYLFQHSKNEMLQELAPDIGKYRCFLFEHNRYGTFIFYLVPTCGTLTANLILFLRTAIHYSRVKSELNKFRQTDSKTAIFLFYKARFVMSIKLFLVFGIPCLFFMLSVLFQIKGITKKIIFVISNLQGVYIFIIFVVKRKVIIDLRKKFNSSQRVDTT